MEIPFEVTRQPPYLPPEWLPYSRATGWKLDATTGVFQGRPLTSQDAGRRTYDDHGPEELLRLGAPAAIGIRILRNWGPIVDKWGLQVLNAAGFINGRVPDELNVSGVFSKERDDPIHPVLQRDMWANLTDREWDIIQPGVQLATAMLDTPDTLRFFAAYFKGHRLVYSPSLSRIIKIVDVPEKLDSEQMKTTYLKLAKMRSKTRFTIWAETEMAKTGALGLTVRAGDPVVTADGATFQSNIFLTSAWLDTLGLYEDYPDVAEDALNHYLDAHGVEPDRGICISAESTRMNATLQFAQVILHELAHAVVMANTPLKDGDMGDLEPFFPDNRTSEAGFSLQKHLSGGHVVGYGSADDTKPVIMHAPYGMNLDLDFDPKPGWRMKNHDEMVHYPVPAGFVSSMFSERHWKEVVGRYGGTELQCPKYRDWAMSYLT